MGPENSESEFVEALVEGTKLALNFDGDVVALSAGLGMEKKPRSESL
ncbi:MAG TPA: hypothetical protein VGL16_04075 [Actinomycetota bacterium]|jgi:hypothetical protein